MTKFQALMVSIVLLALAAVSYQARAATADDVPFFDRSKIRVVRGEADIDVSAADYTSFQALLTIAPAANTAMHDVRLYVDIDQATTGFNDVYGAGTGQLVLARKVDQTNWRREVATITTLTHGGDTDTALRYFDVGTIGPDEQVRLEVLVNAENGDCAFPYSVYYRSQVDQFGNFTEAAN